MFMQLYVLLCIEILEALRSSSQIHLVTTSTSIQIAISTVQQFTTSAIVHHTSSVSSLKSTTTSFSSITQLTQGALMYTLPQIKA